MSVPLKIGFLIYPGLTPLDAIGPAQALSALPNAEVHMVWKDTQPIKTDIGFTINPTVSMAECPDLDILCVPGGGGQVFIMEDQEVLEFLKYQAEQAKYVTSVCSGSLLLAAAGLLKGYKATSHWAVRNYLADYGAEPVEARVVKDGNRFTGGGVTAGIDFALNLISEIAGDEVAQVIQLSLEYDPNPPFNAGSPESAGPQIEALVRARFEQMMSQEGSVFTKHNS